MNSIVQSLHVLLLEKLKLVQEANEFEYNQLQKEMEALQKQINSFQSLEALEEKKLNLQRCIQEQEEELEEKTNAFLLHKEQEEAKKEAERVAIMKSNTESIERCTQKLTELHNVELSNYITDFDQWLATDMDLQRLLYADSVKKIPLATLKSMKESLLQCAHVKSSLGTQIIDTALKKKILTQESRNKRDSAVQKKKELEDIQRGLVEKMCSHKGIQNDIIAEFLNMDESAEKYFTDQIITNFQNNISFEKKWNHCHFPLLELEKNNGCT